MSPPPNRIAIKNRILEFSHALPTFHRDHFCISTLGFAKYLLPFGARSIRHVARLRANRRARMCFIGDLGGYVLPTPRNLSNREIASMPSDTTTIHFTVERVSGFRSRQSGFRVGRRSGAIIAFALVGQHNLAPLRHDLDSVLGRRWRTREMWTRCAQNADKNNVR